MVMRAKVLGREKLMARLDQLAPNAEKYATVAKLEVAKEAASLIAAAAPKVTGEYASEIEGDYVKNRPHQELVGTSESKDPTATAVFAPFYWRFLEWGTAPHNTTKGGAMRAGATADEALAELHPGIIARPHVFPIWRAYKKRALRKIRAAVNKGVREAMGKK
jgi:hypothetical protein